METKSVSRTSAPTRAIADTEGPAADVPALALQRTAIASSPLQPLKPSDALRWQSLKVDAGDRERALADAEAAGADRKTITKLTRQAITAIHALSQFKGTSSSMELQLLLKCVAIFRRTRSHEDEGARKIVHKAAARAHCIYLEQATGLKTKLQRNGHVVPTGKAHAPEQVDLLAYFRGVGMARVANKECAEAYFDQCLLSKLYSREELDRLAVDRIAPEDLTSAEISSLLNGHFPPDWGDVDERARAMNRPHLDRLFDGASVAASAWLHQQASTAVGEHLPPADLPQYEGSNRELVAGLVADFALGETPPSA